MARARTTVVLDEDLLRQAKKAAIDQDRTLSDLVEEALRGALNAAPKRKIELPSWPGGLRPGIDLTNKEQMDELGLLWP
jgi:hypothetical protein